MPRMAYFSTKEIGIILMEFLLQFLILGFIRETPLAHSLKNSAQAPHLNAPLNTVKILELEHDFITIQTENFPMDYPRDYTYIWEVRAPPSRRITIRKNIFDLRAGDRLIVSESLWNKTFELGNFSAAAPEFKKITSLGNVVRLELALEENTSALMVSSSGFVLTCEITGYCSHSDSSRMSCGDQDPNVCFSLGSLSTPAHSHASAHSTAPSTRYGDRCDGVWDCPRGGFDEQNCEFCPRGYLPCASDAASFYSTETTATATTTTTTTSTVVPPLLARLGRKQSRTAGRTGGTGARGTLCYPASARCDGHYNCPDHSDELGCSAEVCSLASQRFLCDPLGPRGQCIPLDSVCNTVPDCYNGADELEELCLRNTSEAAAGFSPEVARLIAQRVARQALETSLVIATTQLDSDLRRVLTYSLSALIAPLLSTLAFGFICRSHAIRARRRLRRAPRFNSPILRLLRDELRRRPPPPTYSEALENSLFEEPILECAAAAAAPPSIPLSATGLTRAQVESVRQRSMKPSNRVDVACYCDLSASASTVSLPPAGRGDDVEEQREPARDEEEEDGVEEEDEGDTDASSEGEEDEDYEEEVAGGGNLPDHPVPSARGDPGPSDPAPPPPGAPAPTAREATTLPPASSGRGGGLWQWMSRLRLLGGPYQPMRAGSAASTPAVVATTQASGSGGAAAAATAPDSGGDLSRRHSDNFDEVDTAGPSRTPSASPGDGAIPASAFAHSPEQTTVPLLRQASQRVIANPDCPPEIPSSPC